MISGRARESETSSDAVDSDIIESTILKNLYIMPEIAFLAPLEVIYTQNGQKLAKLGYLTLKYDLFVIEDDFKCY